MYVFRSLQPPVLTPADSLLSHFQPKPWMKGHKTITRDKKSYFTTLFGILLGVAGGLVLILRSCLIVDHDKYHLLFEDDFSGTTLNKSHWKVEERVGGGESVSPFPLSRPLRTMADPLSLWDTERLHLVHQPQPLRRRWQPVDRADLDERDFTPHRLRVSPAVAGSVS